MRFFTMIFALFVISGASAQFVNNSYALTAGGGLAMMKFKGESGMNSGGDMHLGFEGAFGYSNKVSLGFDLSLLRFPGEIDEREVFYNVSPVMMKIKTYWGGDKRTFYAKGQFGFHTSKLIIEDSRVEDNEFGFAIGGGLGLNQYLSYNLFLTMFYDMKWFGNTEIDNGLAHSFGLRLGYHFRQKNP